jgi:hypothetical protein
MLPVWKVEPAKRKGFVKLTCPRATCQGVIWVQRTLKRKPETITGRRYTSAPCFHCFRTNRLPKDMK